jgi:hypothetical protein
MGAEAARYSARSHEELDTSLGNGRRPNAVAFQAGTCASSVFSACCQVAFFQTTKEDCLPALSIVKAPPSSNRGDDRSAANGGVR